LFACGAIVGIDDNGLFIEVLTGDTDDGGTAPLILLFLFVDANCCSCFEESDILELDVGFGVVLDIDVVVVGIAGNEGFTVFGIPHIVDSVVLTTFRPGLPGSHIFALTSGDIVLIDELPVNCCASTWTLLQIPIVNTPPKIKNKVKLELE
jgi:hypothetical protein